MKELMGMAWNGPKDAKQIHGDPTSVHEGGEVLPLDGDDGDTDNNQTTIDSSDNDEDEYP